ncbi:hypothetical protein TTHERM_00469270 (macronuclear) [Tetrahymena thermophila SB210]|uniref:Uncharacterized protein n=1 Tax=Tetrahymena thermophila (strain SB210) TaxID=312017 RepID=I7MAM4_TETTS|nr:hypothetical protein TTHERM_00469270 [Tetrahymena thermophila SB210]EAS04878.1 hypothetical protein TTHERM_00469270 [Tetrahymena thermophila SB210]|eukprot:XP_001025123.1 hypothetical protein TTHERM_00469270 [Tetrahymena thermophila SB210]
MRILYVNIWISLVNYKVAYKELSEYQSNKSKSSNNYINGFWIIKCPNQDQNIIWNAQNRYNKSLAINTFALVSWIFVSSNQQIKLFKLDRIEKSYQYCFINIRIQICRNRKEAYKSLNDIK